MSTYNPYAYQGYEVKKAPVHKFVISKKVINKWLASLMVIALIVTSFYLITAKAGSSSDDAIHQGEQIVTVSTGDTLWNIASRHYDVRDKNYVVFLIKQRNGLTNDVIKPGQQLILPEHP